MFSLLILGFLHLFSTSGENVTFNQFSAETEFATVGATHIGIISYERFRCKFQQ